jgi:hypothetical protein
VSEEGHAGARRFSVRRMAARSTIVSDDCTQGSRMSRVVR